MTDEIQGERGTVGDGAKKMSKAQEKKIGLAFLVGTGALFLGFMAYAQIRDAKTVVVGPEVAKNTQQPKFQDVTPKQPEAQPVAYQPASALPVAQEVTLKPQAPSKSEAMYEAARVAPMNVYVGEGWAKAGALGGASGGDGGPGGDIEPSDKGAFERGLTAPKLGGAKAGLLGDLNLVIPKGRLIPCVLQTALQSDQAGFTTCEIPRDVLSANGRVVLLEAGTEVIGQYRGGITLGQSRLHVVWTSARTPLGVEIDLGSPGADALGRAGFDGDVDNHFFERFGAAFLLSVVGDATTLGVKQLQGSDIQLNQSQKSGSSAAAIAVEQAGAIKPTLSKNQGEVVSIFVARNLEFGSVYALNTVGGQQRRSLK